MQQQQPDRLRMWTEQGNVTISQLFFQHYKKCDIQDDEALLILHMLAFIDKGNHFPTPDDLVKRSHFTSEQVSRHMQRLFQKGYLSIQQRYDDKGVLIEAFSFHTLWNRLIDTVLEETTSQKEMTQKEQEGEIFRLFEQEFGRFLSPMESETIAMWMDQDQQSPELIRAALKEAVLAQKMSLRYIDRILFEWKKKNVKTMKDVEKQASQFRTVPERTSTPTQPQKTNKVPFYNWLEERE
ncbi:DnaD domain-containing protein [Paenisporosarcina sp.]|uniref:DnaD domain-containing protein n=1 Tax=Paenisporosarcina sp. TaxID=1932001 RepID=UPI003C76AD9B